MVLNGVKFNVWYCDNLIISNVFFSLLDLFIYLLFNIEMIKVWEE